jgi:DNA-directed RNA polymerase specialized sigma24 family protein
MLDLTFKGPLEGWTVNYTKKIYWRVERTHTWEDLMQEAQVVFLKCRARYPDVETPQHFMALYKTSWSRHMVDLARKDTEDRVLVSASEQDSPDGESFSYDPVGELSHDGDLALLLHQAPSEIKAVLGLMLQAPKELLDIALAGWNGLDRRCKAGGSRKICRMLGLPEDMDVLTQLYDYLKH